jgi:hypothetical protein
MAEDDLAVFVQTEAGFWQLVNYVDNNQNAGPHAIGASQVAYIPAAGGVLTGHSGFTYDGAGTITVDGVNITDDDGNNAITFKRNTTFTCSGLTANQFQIYADTGAGADEAWMCDDANVERRFARFDAGTFGEELFTLNAAATPATTADGQLVVDIDGFGTNFDAIETWNGTESAYIVATQASDTPSNGEVPTFKALVPLPTAPRLY